MTYLEQLNTPDWKNKRNKILKRDKFKCSSCSNEKIIATCEKGLVRHFLSNNENAIFMDIIGKEKIMISKIKQAYRHILTKPGVVYSMTLPNRRQMVVGMRRLNPSESKSFSYYQSQIKELEEKHRNPFEALTFDEMYKETSQLRERRRIKFIEIEQTNNPIEFVWLFMSGLHIHHKYYIKEFLAWEYDDEALITLCQFCHENLHENGEIPVYNTNFKKLGNYLLCKRCHGAGRFPEFSHVQNGICFRCKGVRYEELIIENKA